MVRTVCMNKFRRAAVWYWGPIENLAQNPIYLNKGWYIKFTEREAVCLYYVKYLII